MKKASEAVGNRRLLKLAAFLRTVPRRRFDYNVFVGEDWQGAQDLSCGTRACALGWAAVMPTFRRLGLHLDPNSHYPALRGAEGPFEAAAELFGLTMGEADDLFAPGINPKTHEYESRVTAKYVARKIERFVADRRKAA